MDLQTPPEPEHAEAVLIYAEDLPPGRRFDLGSRTLSQDEIVAFASAWDPLPIHIDAEAAARSVFGGLIASGMHTIAVAVRMVTVTVVQHSAMIAGRGMRDVQLRKPVRPGMRLTGSLEVMDLELRVDGTAVTSWNIRLHDNDEDLVLSIHSEAKIRRRPGAG